MTCFHITTPAGRAARITGDPNMAPETLEALGRMCDLAYEQLERKRLRPLAYELAGVVAEFFNVDADADRTNEIAQILERALEQVARITQ